MPSPAVSALSDSQGAINSAEVSFENFTVSLVQGTMTALVASALSQMKAYADLVSTIENGLAAFQKQAVPIDGSTIVSWIQNNLPDVSISTDGTNKIVVPSPGKWTAPSVSALSDLYLRATKIAGSSSALKLGTAVVDQTLVGGGITGTEFASSSDPTTNPNVLVPANAVALTSSSTTATVLDAVNAVLHDDAALAYSQLNALIKMGLYRIVVQDGHILTKATFNLRANDQTQQSSSNVGVSSFSANAHANYGVKVFNAGVSASYSQLSIRVANESSSSSTSITETVMGEVLVNFKGDYFPAATVQSQA